MGTNIMFWNCQSIGPKRKELELYLKENNFDIVALNGTFLTKKIDFKIQGYDTIKNGYQDKNPLYINPQTKTPWTKTPRQKSPEKTYEHKIYFT